MQADDDQAGLETPVLFLVFNRPSTTQRVFEAIAAARPRRLYVAADGPRAERPGEAQTCEAVRRLATAVSWPCEVATLFRSENLGCGRAIASALDWFFENEPEGIVLEDDCLPAPAFFPYCAALLSRYRDDPRIAAISGDSFQDETFETPGSYYFSRYNHVWGWASWRRAWALYDRELSDWPRFRDSGGLDDQAPGDEAFAEYWTFVLDRVAAGLVDTWDYQWTFTAWLHGALTCLPARNLVTNIGVGAEATHTHEADGWTTGRNRGTLTFPLRHPPTVTRNTAADRFTDRRVYGIGSRRLKNKSLLGSRTLQRAVEEAKAVMRKLLSSRTGR